MHVNISGATVSLYDGRSIRIVPIKVNGEVWWTDADMTIARESILGVSMAISQSVRPVAPECATITEMSKMDTAGRISR